jgi:hypothetical protein
MQATASTRRRGVASQLLRHVGAELRPERAREESDEHQKHAGHRVGPRHRTTPAP